MVGIGLGGEEGKMIIVIYHSNSTCGTNPPQKRWYLPSFSVVFAPMGPRLLQNGQEFCWDIPCID
jgi:hypothetical protein